MFFRNLSWFRYPCSARNALQSLEERLAEHPLKPVGPLAVSSRGFVAPCGGEAATRVHRIGECAWIMLGREDRLLPATVVNDALAKKLAEIEASQGRKPGGKARKQIKEDLIHEMLPRAFVKSSRIAASLDARQGTLVIDAASKKSAESVLSELRHALGSFPAQPLKARCSVVAKMTGWLRGEPLPEGLVLGDECELKDPLDGGAVVRVLRQELTAEEITKHLDCGKQVSKLALVLDDRLRFVLGEDLVLRKLKLLDGAVDSLENTERDSLAAELDARYALFSAELHGLFGVIERTFELEPAG